MKSVSTFALTALAVWMIFHTKSVIQLESFKLGGLRSFEIVPLESVSETSSNASIGDLNGDGIPDVVLSKGRHWPLASRIFFSDGTGHFTLGPPLPPEATTRSYAASLADMTKSGRLDIVLSGDAPDPKLILLNDALAEIPARINHVVRAVAVHVSNCYGRRAVQVLDRLTIEM